ncbi:YbaB/EbfC family nucleoid-associated protein [Kutzneria sp. NPDC052558]|uniref:YbaB/EbfC family nucleoid-associated protein n=1 Tax=Kutzneria sp. NPDC052558 TaxID=3364121 RepID=UPI0037C5102D
MSSPYDESIKELMGEFHQQLDQLNETNQRMQEITATATSPRKSVSITVGAQGRLVEFKFPNDAYKRMAPVELANVITETFTAAQQQVQAQLMELMQANVPAGFDLSALYGPDADIGKVLPREPIMPDAVRAYIEDGQ